VSRGGPASERAIILAPNGRDSQLASQILSEGGLAAKICADIPTMSHELGRGAALAVIADEAIHAIDLRPLTVFLETQPPWSDFPIIVLTHRGGGPERNPAAARLAKTLGNVTFLERPFHPTTLVSVVSAAVRGRRRQYEARARLEDLSEAGRQLQTAMLAGHLGAWSLSVETMAFEASKTCRAHFGVKAGAAFSFEDLRSAAHPEDSAAMRSTLDHTLRTGVDYVIEYRTLWQDGSTHWIDMRARAVKNPAGAVEQLVGVSSDITDRKTSELEKERLLAELAVEREALSDLTMTLERRVQERTEELIVEVSAREKAQEQLLQSQKMESIGQLTGGIAHDFNNLLMAVMGNLELLRKQTPDNPRALRLIDGAIQGAERGASLTQRMLAFARQQDLRTNSMDIASLVTGMHDLLERSLGPHIALRLEVSDGLPPAQVDANQVELAILNLAINARDAMPDGGAIAIKADQAPGNRGNLPAASYIRIQVSDTGSGMDPTTLQKAIEPFFSTKPLGKGTGLGLSMVHGLAVQLGGLLELSSEIGSGTLATLWLPIATRPVGLVEPPPVETAPNRAATILVVDDDPLIAMSTVDMLEDLGHTVIEANSAKQALAIVEGGQELDLMMTDQAMPGMTGTELAQIVRAQRPNLPVLLATGYADLPAGQKSDLPRLSKPYHQSQLQSEIERLLGRPR
jgi:nitrogen-specific signal transduction histidine kinase/FixJ family two-component response regulator